MRIVNLVFTIIFLSSQTSFAQTKVLFQGRGWGSNWYLTLVGDTAYFEQFKMDKAPAFAAFDTLIRSGENNNYRGKNTMMVKEMDTISLYYKSGPFRGRTFQFLKADAIQIQKWEGYKHQN